MKNKKLQSRAGHVPALSSRFGNSLFQPVKKKFQVAVIYKGKNKTLFSLTVFFVFLLLVNDPIFINGINNCFVFFSFTLSQRLFVVLTALTISHYSKQISQKHR